MITKSDKNLSYSFLAFRNLLSFYQFGLIIILASIIYLLIKEKITKICNIAQDNY